MSEFSTLPGLSALWQLTQGSSGIVVAVLDGHVDTAHSCFQGARLSRLQTLLEGDASTDGQMSAHGTHIASVIFGQPGSPVEGIAPGCQGTIAPIFADDRRQLSQLDLARTIEQAVEAGAHIINISGGSLTDIGEAEDWLDRAVRLCRDRNILIVAAAGNDGCDCLHVPAALPAVLSVGAMDAAGNPLNFSNWGTIYQQQGILAPGASILGARPGGGTLRLDGTSFATPIVTGVAALLLSLQVQRGETPNPQAVRDALLASALPCTFTDAPNDRKCLAGRLNIPGAVQHLIGETMSESLVSPAESTRVDASGCSCSPPDADPEDDKIIPQRQTESIPVFAAGISEAVAPSTPVAAAVPASVAVNSMPANPVTAQGAIVSEPTPVTSNAVTPSQTGAAGLVYALGVLGYDFGSEARRDSFKQLMPPVDIGGGVQVPANPYDATQMVTYLGNNLSEASSLLWTLNLELNPIYAIEPKGSFARDVYTTLQQLLNGQVQAETSAEYIERVSIPGKLTGRTVRLFSGQVVPVIEPESPRGIYGWKVNTLVDAALQAVTASQPTPPTDAQMRRTLTSFLHRVYYDLRNLGQTSQDRALNFAATNAFQAAQTFSEAIGAGMELDSINIQKSPFCRIDSDCWDVQLKFFDPENNLRAKKVFRFTIDVSDLIPVTLGEVRSWATAY